MTAFAVCLGLAYSGCDKLPLLAPQQSTIVVSSASSIVQANGSTDIRATVLEQGGTPVQNGTVVTFTTNLGALTPTESRTTNGVAIVQFVGNGQSGRASIKAISGGAASEALEIVVGAAAASRLSVTANPTSVPSTGGTTTITAIVLDASGNPLASVPVTFTTTSGTLSAAVVNTDFTGAARTTLTTSRDATVSATSGGATAAQVTVAISARPTISITVASGSTPAVGGITIFTITANPGTGGLPLQSIVVDYGDGSSDDLGTTTGTFAVQHVYDNDGTFTPRVTATDTSGASSTASTVIVVQPLIVSIGLTSTNANTANLQANVSPAGVAIANYAWTFGDGSSTNTGASPTASHTYAAAGTYTVRVTARTSTGSTGSGSLSVRVP